MGGIVNSYQRSSWEKDFDFNWEPFAEKLAKGLTSFALTRYLKECNDLSIQEPRKDKPVVVAISFDITKPECAAFLKKYADYTAIYQPFKDWFERFSITYQARDGERDYVIGKMDRVAARVETQVRDALYVCSFQKGYSRMRSEVNRDCNPFNENINPLVIKIWKEVRIPQNYVPSAYDILLSRIYFFLGSMDNKGEHFVNEIFRKSVNEISIWQHITNSEMYILGTIGAIVIIGMSYLFSGSNENCIELN